LRLASPNASEARNRGFLASSGRVVLFIDDDLVPEDDFCARGLAIFDNYPEIGCFSPLVYNAEGREPALKQAKARRISSLDQGSGIFSITDTLSAALFFKRDYFEMTGGFDPMLFEFARTAEDQELFLRMRKRRQLLYFIPSLEIYHDETIPGGCDLRTADYWITREKCMRSWAYRYRIHHHPPGSLSAGDIFQLARSGFLNREVLSSGIKNISRQVGLLSGSVKASGEYLNGLADRYATVEKINHLNR